MKNYLSLIQYNTASKGLNLPNLDYGGHLGFLIIPFFSEIHHKKAKLFLTYNLYFYGFLLSKRCKKTYFSSKIEKLWLHLGFSPRTGYRTCRRPFLMADLDSSQNFALKTTWPLSKLQKNVRCAQPYHNDEFI